MDVAPVLKIPGLAGNLTAQVGTGQKLPGTELPAHQVVVGWTFVKCLAGHQGNRLAAFHLHDDGPFQYINKSVSIVTMNRVSPAGFMLHRDHQHFLTGNIR